MENLTAIITWVTANWVGILAVAGSIVTTAAGIAKMTPSETDNKAVGYALKILDFLAINTKPTEVKKK